MKLKNILLRGMVAFMISGCNGYALKSDLYNSFAAEPASQSLCSDFQGNPECKFTNMPDVKGNVLNITDTSNSEDIFVVRGTLKDVEGMPLCNAYIYGSLHDHINSIQGWCKTNNKGEYEIRTIHPPTANGLLPHIHLAVKLSRLKKAFFIDELVLNDSTDQINKDLVLQ